MSEALLLGVCIGYAALILLKELELQLCRLCLVFWMSIFLAVVTWNWFGVGLMNLVAHISYIIFAKVCYNVENLAVSIRVEKTASKESTKG